ncbi:sigma-70 family RNA polymerase sigma factor [Williamsia phyllosphaerae]|nr:sigma-70 family RNA polymerase sigma factor [Williamsia phyllosphaerae]
MNATNGADVSTDMSLGSVIELHFDVASAFDEHASVMLGFAVNALRDRTLAEDCVQETFVRAWRARARFDPGRGSVRTWLFAIERNVIIDAQRSAARLPVPTMSLLTDDPGQLRDGNDDTIERLRIVEALALLSPEHRQVIVAVHLTGTTYTELAASTGVPVRTLRTRAFYGLRALRNHLDDQEDR